MTREFLDPKTLLITAVTDWLLAQARTTPGGARALDHLLVIVPTRQAGRRLRLTLADRTGGCIPPKICQPHHLLTPAREPAHPVATPTESMGILAETLTHLDLTAYPDLFPEQGRPAEQTFQWALNVARQLHDLWRVLQENALTMQDVAPRVSQLLRDDNLDTETRRWQDLAHVEAHFFAALNRHRLTPIALAQQHAAHNPAIPGNIERIVLPALTDALPACYTALKTIERAIPLTLLIHADPAEDPRFDTWGRPDPTRWTGEHAPQLPLDDSQITLAANSLEQARQAAARYTSCAAPALGMADDALFNDLQSAFLTLGITLHNPADYPLAASPLGRLISLLQRLASGQRYTTLAALLREADLQRWLEHALPALNYAEALRTLDTLQNQHLPQTLPDVHPHLTPSSILHAPLALLNPHAKRLTLLRTLFAPRTLRPETPGDRDLIAAADATRELLDTFDSDALRAALSPGQLDQLFAASLTTATYQLEPDTPGTIPTDGWLELQWNPAPELIITGLNEGSVPDAVVGHAFLPDRLRHGLGLTTNAQRMARDTCLFQSLTRSRPPRAVHLLLERVSAQHDVRKPSRLLFLCDDPTLAARANTLFAEPEAAPAGHPRTLPPAWRLSLPLPPPAPKALGATAFRDYLACPFTYYLRRVLKMEAQDDRTRELDAIAFGNLCHSALDAFAQSAHNGSADPKAIQAFLENHVWQTLRERFGNSLTAVIHLQGAAACERLAFAAREQARLAAQGWRIRHSETTAERDTLGITIRGRIDRIDSHEATGARRILDYKTWPRLGDNNGLDRFSTAKHTAIERAQADGLTAFTLPGTSKPRVWTDLQLPLYLMMDTGHPVQDIGYFVLGETPADTLVKTWDCRDFTDCLASAEATARQVVRRIQAGIFWPPRALAPEFHPLFLDPHTPEASLSPDWLHDQQERIARNP